MARRSIKLFRRIQKFYQILGIYPSQENEKILFNSRNLFILFFYVQLCISMAAFLILKAKTMQEYGATFFMFLTQFYVTLDFSILMWQMPNILSLITDFEEFIEKSKWKLFHFKF